MTPTPIQSLERCHLNTHLDASESRDQGVVCKIKALLKWPWKVEMVQINCRNNGVEDILAKLARELRWCKVNADLVIA
ncbi:hypothetical protein V6N13_048788 [Hibiscus sabdariffa]